MLGPVALAQLLASIRCGLYVMTGYANLIEVMLAAVRSTYGPLAESGRKLWPP